MGHSVGVPDVDPPSEIETAPRRRPGPAAVGLAAALVVMAAAMELAARYTYNGLAQLWILLGANAAFVPAVVLLRRLERRGVLRRVTAVVFATSVLLQVLAISGPPGDSDDDWRYLWDGRVQIHGIDPYRYSARAHELTGVRTDAIFPPQRPCTYHKFAEDGLPETDKNGCTRMNRPRVNTLYPPVAEAFFAVVSAVSLGGHGNEFTMQLCGALGVTLTGWLLWRRARARGDPVWWVAVWLWCPTVLLEAVQNAHIDWLGALFVVLAFAAVPARRVVLRGLLIGAATGVKLYPAAVGASLLRRRPVALVVSAAGLLALSYVPHVLDVGTRVLGFLPGYLQQEDYSSGTRYLLISLVATGRAASVVAVLVMVAVLVWAVWRGDPEHPERTAVVVVGTAMLVATPNQAWYTILLVALAVLAHRPEWLVVGPVMQVFYLLLTHVPDVSVVGRWGFVLSLFVVVGTSVWRHTRGPLSGPTPATPPDRAATAGP